MLLTRLLAFTAKAGEPETLVKRNGDIFLHEDESSEVMRISSYPYPTTSKGGTSYADQNFSDTHFSLPECCEHSERWSVWIRDGDDLKTCLFCKAEIR